MLQSTKKAYAMPQPATIFNTADLENIIECLLEVIQKGQTCNVTMIKSDKGYEFVAAPLLNGEGIQDASRSILYSPTSD